MIALSLYTAVTMTRTNMCRADFSNRLIACGLRKARVRNDSLYPVLKLLERSWRVMSENAANPIMYMYFRRAKPKGNICLLYKLADTSLGLT